MSIQRSNIKRKWGTGVFSGTQHAKSDFSVQAQNIGTDYEVACELSYREPKRTDGVAEIPASKTEISYMKKQEAASKPVP